MIKLAFLCSLVKKMLAFLYEENDQEQKQE